ncbi:MAG TPA: hypothetical protein DCS93_38275 [Microscillaceae bacterium]|nr:hypothetical protein [Microscillaceae bacterium]
MTLKKPGSWTYSILKHAWHAIFFVCVLVCLEGCRNKTLKDYGHDVNAIKNEVKSRKIHRVSEKEFQQWTADKGSEISRIAQKYLNRAYNKGLETNQIASAKEFAKLLPLANIDSLAKTYQVDIQSISFERTQVDNLYAIEADYWKKYKSGETALEPTTEYVENRRKRVFIAPIYLKEAVGMWSIHFERQNVIQQIVKEREKKKKKKRRS